MKTDTVYVILPTQKPHRGILLYTGTRTIAVVPSFSTESYCRFPSASCTRLRRLLMPMPWVFSSVRPRPFLPPPTGYGYSSCVTVASLQWLRYAFSRAIHSLLRFCNLRKTNKDNSESNQENLYIQKPNPEN